MTFADLHDAFATPTWLAQQVVKSCRPSVAKIVDLAAGEGALLAAAVDRYPQATVVAVELNPDTALRLQAARPRWRVVAGDGIRVAVELGEERPRADLVLLNPPFSYRGGSHVKVASGVIVNRPLAFVLAGLSLLDRSGELVAVLPRGALRAERNAQALRLLAEEWEVEQVPLGPSVFARATVDVMVTHWRRRSGAVDGAVSSQGCEACAVVRPHWLVRGSVPVHRAIGRATRDGDPFIHTSALKGSAVLELPRFGPRSPGPRFHGPAVLVHRVGQPAAHKVTPWLVDAPVVLSDCIFALRMRDADAAEEGARIIIDEYSDFSELYMGSGAPYVTIRDLKAFVEARPSLLGLVHALSLR